MVVSVFSEIPPNLNTYDNLLDSNSTVISRYYSSIDSWKQGTFFQVNLKPNTDYTFYAPNGSVRFYVGEKVLYNNYNSVFLFDSWNKFSGGSTLIGSGYPLSIFELPDIELGETYYLVGTGSNVTSSYFNILFQLGTGYSNRHVFYSDQIYGVNNRLVIPFTVTQDMYNTYGYDFTLQLITTGGESSFEFIMVSEEEYVNDYLPYYSHPFFNDEFTYVYNFTTSSSISSSSNILIGIKDPYYSDSSFFSTLTYYDHYFYLFEGKLTVDDLANVNLQESYQNGYNDGYDKGYSKGETSGLESSMFMRNIFFTIVSSPFIFIRNALDFDFLGINFRDIAMIIISATLVAWVIRVFKKGE